MNDPVRIAPLDPAQFSAEQKDVVGPWSVLNFTRVLAHHPHLYRVFIPLIEKLIRYTELSPQDREVLVIRTLALCKESYEAAHHVDIARQCGMSETQIAAIAAGETAGLSEREILLMQAADELVKGQRIGDATWAALSQQYSTVQLIEVVGLVGGYVTMAMITRSFGIQNEAADETAEKLAELREYR